MILPTKITSITHLTKPFLNKVRCGRKEKSRRIWNSRLNDLRRYRQEHGHANVPKNYKGIPGLAEWIVIQREQYELMKQCKSSNMTKERVSYLETLGFVWNLSRTSSANKLQHEPRHRQCKVTNNRRKHEEGLWSQWEYHGTKESSRIWSQWIERLKQYKAEHGDCFVPEDYKADPKLGCWVASQRRHYRSMKEGKRSNLSKRRMEELEMLGFDLETNNGKQVEAGRNESEISLDESLSPENESDDEEQYGWFIDICEDFDGEGSNFSLMNHHCQKVKTVDDLAFVPVAPKSRKYDAKTQCARAA